MSKQFIRVTLIPTAQGDLLFEKKEIIIHVSTIWEIALKRQNEYIIELDPEVSNMIEKKYFGRTTIIKEILITEADVKNIAPGTFQF